MCFVTCLYQSPSQNQQVFESFGTNLDPLMDHINNEFPSSSVLIVDFNTRCSKWCNNDITNANVHAVDTLKSSGGHKRIINKSTHTVNNSFSCIGLIFCNNLNLISNYGVYFLVFGKCQHNIIFGKINIRIPLPLRYFCEVWDYRKANVKTIHKTIQTFDWVKAFGNLSADGKVDILNEGLRNIFRNYFANEKVKCNYCPPPWINDKIKPWLRERSKFYYKHSQKKRRPKKKKKNTNKR